jgi:hypothetical protein
MESVKGEPHTSAVEQGRPNTPWGPSPYMALRNIYNDKLRLETEDKPKPKPIIGFTAKERLKSCGRKRA